MSMTTIKVSRNTLRELEMFKKSLNITTYDEAIRRLLKEYRRNVLKKYFGIDSGRVSEFREEDRGGDREVNC